MGEATGLVDGGTGHQRIGFRTLATHSFHFGVFWVVTLLDEDSVVSYTHNIKFCLSFCIMLECSNKNLYAKLTAVSLKRTSKTPAPDVLISPFTHCSLGTQR